MILNFIDTVGFGDSQVTYDDDEIVDLIKAELMEKTLCKQIDAILVFENPRSDAIGINQTIIKIAKLFGPQCKESVIVIMPHSFSVSHIPKAIDQRIETCDELGIDFIEWESKDVTEE